MKKFFTLIACALVAGSAFAQEDEYQDPVNAVENGKIAWNTKVYDDETGTADFANYAGKLGNYQAHDFVTGTKEAFIAPRVTVDPADKAAFDDAVALGDGFATLNYCLTVQSSPSATEVWDSQFFVTFPDYTVNTGDSIIFSMDVRADLEDTTDPETGELVKTTATISTQTHAAPGSYKGGFISNMTVTNEWKTFTGKVKVGADGVYTLVFNLNENKTQAIQFYFDNIKVSIRKPVQITDFTDWTSIIKNGDFEGEETGNFFVTQNATGDGRYLATIVDGIGNEDTKGVTAQSSGKEKQEWDSQFFVLFDKKLPSNTKVHLKFDYKAKEAGKVTTQTHKTPGSYVGGGIGDLSCTTEWQTFDKVVTLGNSSADLQTLVFNLAPDKKWNIFYFDNFVAEVKNDVYATLTDGAEFEAKGEQEVLPDDPLAAVKADLAAAIDKGKLFTDYLKTEESFAALTQAIADGEAEAAKAGATQETLEAAKNAIADAIDGLAYEGAEYTKLTKDMYFRYDDVEGNGDGAQQGCSYDLGLSSGLPYGDGNVSEIMWANLSEFEKLIVVVADGTPRFCMNRLVAGGQQAETQEESKMLDINPNNGYTWSTEKYQTKDGDNVYVIDLKAIVEDYGFARLHCIKGSHYANATVIDMILWDEETATPISTVKPAKAAAKAIFNLAGQQIKSLQKGLNIVDGKKVLVK